MPLKHTKPWEVVFFLAVSAWDPMQVYKYFHLFPLSEHFPDTAEYWGYLLDLVPVSRMDFLQF